MFRFRSMKLGTKLACGFGVMIVIAGVLGGVGWYGLRSVALKADLAERAAQMVTDSLQGRVHEKNFILRKDAKYRDEARALAQEFATRTQETAAKLQSAADVTAVQGIGRKMNDWLTSLEHYVTLEDQKASAA